MNLNFLTIPPSENSIYWNLTSGTCQKNVGCPKRGQANMHQVKGTIRVRLWRGYVWSCQFWTGLSESPPFIIAFMLARWAALVGAVIYDVPLTAGPLVDLLDLSSLCMTSSGHNGRNHGKFGIGCCEVGSTFAAPQHISRTKGLYPICYGQQQPEHIYSFISDNSNTILDYFEKLMRNC